MFNSFKNTELFRYFIRTDLNRNINKIIQQNKSNFSIIAGSIFSGSFSILGTYYGMNGNEYNVPIRITVTSLLFCALFIVAMVSFQGFCYVVKFLYNSIKKESLPNKEKIKELIDDFDHIACDNILISQNFINAYREKSIEPNLKEFYFYEIIYYADKSINIIRKLFFNKDSCINDRTNTNRVHLYRIENALEMLTDIQNFIVNNEPSIQVDDLMRNSLISEINRLERNMEVLRKNCDDIKQDRYGNN